MDECECKDEDLGCAAANEGLEGDEPGFLLEQWFINVAHHRFVDQSISFLYRIMIYVDLALTGSLCRRKLYI